MDKRTIRSSSIGMIGDEDKVGCFVKLFSCGRQNVVESRASRGRKSKKQIE